MFIKEIIIENYKKFEGRFELFFNNGVNIIVGDNEAGKSTILEAINLALSGYLNGRSIRTELSQNIFNVNTIAKYLHSLKSDKIKCLAPPKIVIELYFGDSIFPDLEGNGNSKHKNKENGIKFEVSIKDDEDLRKEYEDYVKTGNIKSLPIEYYDYSWSSFARESKTPRTIPIKSALIDSSSSRFQNGSDVYISRIVKDFLENKDVISVTQAHRKLKDEFSSDDSIKAINEKINNAAKISKKKVSLDIDFSTKDAWENSLTTCLDNIPFHYIGKGEQCVIKTKLALAHEKAKQASILLLEEPENHLSHSKLNGLLFDVSSDNKGKQIIVTTHSSFVANKLGLNNIIFLHDCKTIRLNNLTPETSEFFEKLSGYDTLRLMLCKKAILVEGDSDELIVQKAYLMKKKKLPIEDEIEVISVGLSFKRFIELGEKIGRNIVVVTDNDGRVSGINKNYKKYIEDESLGIKICFDKVEDNGKLKIGNKKFNYNTLEPKLIKANTLKIITKILEKESEITEMDELHKYMNKNKTKCALLFFNTKEKFEIPKYIMDAIDE